MERSVEFYDDLSHTQRTDSGESIEWGNRGRIRTDPRLE